MDMALAAGCSPRCARAGLTVDIHLYHDSYGYYFYPWLSANAVAPNFPIGIYQIASPQIPPTVRAGVSGQRRNAQWLLQ